MGSIQFIVLSFGRLAASNSFQRQGKTVSGNPAMFGKVGSFGKYLSVHLDVSVISPGPPISP
jgi:hypothetical protein